MDRLPAVGLALGLALAGCGDDADKPAAPARERVNAVKASADDRVTAAELCDVFPAAAEAPAFSWPALAGETPASAPGHWTWVNVWATWCAPCIEELPRLSEWQRRLASEGGELTLHLLSADESEDAVAGFRERYPATPASLRIASPAELPAWLASLGVADAALPVHVFVDPSGRVRCVRASAVNEPDYAAVQSLMRYPR